VASFPDEDRIVTDYSRFYTAPRAQVERLAESLGLNVPSAEIDRAVASLTASGGPPEVVNSDSELPPEIRDLFETLLEATASSGTGAGVAVDEQGSAGSLREAVAAQRAELEHLRLELARRRGQVEAIQVQLDVRTMSENELRQVIHDLHEQLVERDDEIASLRADLMRRLDAEDCLRRAVAALEDKLASVETTRLWRLGKRYWSLKRSIGSAVGRGKP
jgi:hypothetical protein